MYPFSNRHHGRSHMMFISRVFTSRAAVLLLILPILSQIAQHAGAGALVSCQPAGTPTGCTLDPCSIAGQTCVPRCVRQNPQAGTVEALQCECLRGECHAALPPVSGNPCVLPDNGNGTVHLPPAGCAYRHAPNDPWRIIDGLPPLTTIDIQSVLTNFVCDPLSGTVCSFAQPPTCYQAGGTLGGEKSCSDATIQFNMNGTGALVGYHRMIPIPVRLEIHTGPTNVGQPLQEFPTNFFRLFGQVVGDPDFDLLRVVVGTDFGLPSPGHTYLTQLPGGDWAVDSFFDITYRIDFVGAPGGALGGMSGSTTGTVRMSTGSGPLCEDPCQGGFECRRVVVVNSNGSIDVCCECVSPVCEPTTNGDACEPIVCPGFDQECVATCVRHNPSTGHSSILSCDCRDPDTCHAERSPLPPNPCVIADAGNGTVHLPPVGCSYRHDPNEPWKIIDGLPPLTTVDIHNVHTNFVCDPNNFGVCSFPQPPFCYQPGGFNGGEQSCAISTFQMQLIGTGTLNGYFRNMACPVAIEIRAAARTVGDPVQSFPTQMFRLFGQIVGDPDFDLLRFVGGTDFGLPSPGHTTLTQLPGGDWAVDSFFDITYRIDFVGAPGGPLAGRSGSTTGTVRMSTGNAPRCVDPCPQDHVCRMRRVINPDGTIDTCCDCILFCSCYGDMNGDTKINGLDIQAFVNCYVGFYWSPIPAQCACADVDESGSFSPDDVELFVSRLLAAPKIECVPPQ